jgi:asparagine synthase (glutamine-hydrolysing)
MRPRYLLVALSPGQKEEGLVERLAERTGLTLAFSAPRLAALVNEHCNCLPVGESGVIVGSLFRRDGGPAAASLGAAEAAAIARSEGGELLRRYWGGYVATLAGREVGILRDPSGTFPCYFATGPGLAAFASDADLLIEAGLVPVEVDWAAIARHFFAAGVPSQVTALCGVNELLPGFAARFADRLESPRPCWSPWDHVEGEYGGGAAAERLSQIVRRCVRSLASGHGRLLASVSGGLDSSIVAASLAGAGADTICLTCYGDDPASDERPFARALCDRIGLPLFERRYDVEAVEIKEPLGTHLPRPADRTQALAYEHAHLETAREMKASAFITGNGGDSVFGYSQSASSLADRYLSQGIGKGLLRTLRDLCLQTGCCPIEAAAAAARIARGPRGYRCRPNPLFLEANVIAGLEAAGLDHPWLKAPAHALPGKSAHIASILRVQQCLEPSRSRFLPVLNPLMSQPVIEACLGVPSWEWRAGGRDRSLARRAFADDLPPIILRRRVKGGPDGFAAQIVDRFRPGISERLLDGRLARESILDIRALELALGSERPMSGEHRVRILELLAAEAWLDSWCSRAAAAPRGPCHGASVRALSRTQ